MSLKHILLGLAERECSGYDIKKEFDKSLRNFWRAELSQIYPLLQKLEREGLLTGATADSSHGPKRKVYERTDQGSATLKEWLSSGPVVATERIQFLAQVYFLHELETDEERLLFMEKLRNYFAGRLAFLRRVEDGWSKEYDNFPEDLPDNEFYPYLTLSCGKARITATVAWCEETIAQIRRRKAS